MPLLIGLARLLRLGTSHHEPPRRAPHHLDGLAFRQLDRGRRARRPGVALLVQYESLSNKPVQEFALHLRLLLLPLLFGELPSLSSLPLLLCGLCRFPLLLRLARRFCLGFRKASRLCGLCRFPLLLRLMRRLGFRFCLGFRKASRLCGLCRFPLLLRLARRLGFRFCLGFRKASRICGFCRFLLLLYLFLRLASCFCLGLLLAFRRLGCLGGLPFFLCLSSRFFSRPYFFLLPCLLFRGSPFRKQALVLLLLFGVFALLPLSLEMDPDPACGQNRAGGQQGCQQQSPEAARLGLALQRVGKRHAVREAVVRVFREGLRKGLVGVRREMLDRGRPLLQHRTAEDKDIVPVERKLPRKKPVRHHRERVLVRRRALRLAAPLLWGFVRRRSALRYDHVARAAQARADLRGKAEVEDVYASGRRDHDVAGLDVAMQHLAAVRVVERGCDLPYDRQARLQVGILVLAHPSAEVIALRKVHHKVVVPVFIFLERTDACDVRMAKVAYQLEVRSDLLHLPGVVSHVRRHPLHGDIHAPHLVKALVDNPHSPLAQLGLDDISAKYLVPCLKPPYDRLLRQGRRLDRVIAAYRVRIAFRCSLFLHGENYTISCPSRLVHSGSAPTPCQMSRRGGSSPI